jgi:hypothetical protein
VDVVFDHSCSRRPKKFTTSTNRQLPLGTVQEHALASNVVFQYGQHTINAELAILAREAFYIHIISRDCCRQLVKEDDGHAYQKTVECLKALWLLDCVRANMKYRSIIYWISLFASREVTDPRDKVYGLLGLAVGDEIGMVEPDYTSSLEEVFYAAALGSIKRNKNLDVLSYLVGERSDQLPSFVPDWAHQPDFMEYERRLFTSDLFSAATDTIARVKEIVPGKLAVTGIFVDTVVENLFPYETWEEKFEKYQLLFYKGDSSKVTYHHTGEPREIAWWITICGGIDVYPHMSGVTNTLRRMGHLKDLSRFRELESWLKAPTLNESLLTPEVFHLNRLFREATYGRSLIFTERGYIVGFGPEPISFIRLSHEFPPRTLFSSGTFCSEQLLTPPVPRVWPRCSAKRVTWSQSSLVEKYPTFYGPKPLRNLQKKKRLIWIDVTPLSEMPTFTASWMAKQ